MAAAAGAPPVFKTCDKLVCEITRYDCRSQDGKRGKNLRVNLLADVATAQQRGDPHPFDPRVLPWEDRCSPGIDRHYVAKSRRLGDETICGWLSLNVIRKKLNGVDRKYAYLDKISTRRKQGEDDPYYGGVGKCLHDRLVEDLRKEGFDFIYLYPIDGPAATVYARWGYIHPAHFEDTVKQMFFMLKTAELPQPPRDLLESMRAPHEATLRSQAHEIINGRSIFGRENGAPDPELIAMFTDAHRRIDPQAISDAIDVMGGYEAEDPLSIKEQQDLMRDAFNVKRGGRRTLRVRRANTHRLRFFRKHHLPEHGYSLKELAKISKVPRPILQEVYNRGIGAYKTNPTSVRMKGTYKKGVSAPYRMKLSKEQWAMARVYSFLDKNPKHDTDLR